MTYTFSQMGNVSTQQIQIGETRIRIDETVTWSYQINNATVKLSSANAVLSKIRHSEDFKTVKSIYHVISESHFKTTEAVTQRGLWENVF